MNLKRTTSCLLMAFAMTTSGFAQQPLNGCWHPKDIKEWTPDNVAKFPDNKFNVSKVPLQKRFKEPVLMKANPSQWYEGQICNSTILYPTCSQCPSQGELDNFLGYQPTYWQYMDKLVYWAGSASEGIINIPPAASTDAAHAQGVKVLGNIFFPPYAFGGDATWLSEMLEQKDGKYYMAVKLYEIAKYFGFDGWFINEETGGGNSPGWEGFFEDFYAAAEADGNYDMELQWYNASHTPNVELLKTNKNTSQFLEYGSGGDYRDYASQIGCSREDIFSKIYAGIQCASSGHTGWAEDLEYNMPDSGHVGSMDLFCPEVGIWEKVAKSAFNSKTENHGENAYDIGLRVFHNDRDMWVNTNDNPAYVNPNAWWKGVSAHVLERSTITSMPFLCDMGVGNGKHRFVEGEKRGTRDWYHSGMQSILPTWRWWIENQGDLSVDIDWDDAYNVGSSFKISGALTQGDHLMRLYKTQIDITDGGVLRVVYKNGQGMELEAKLSTESSVNPDVTLTNPTTTTKNGWTIADFDLSGLNGKTLRMVALNLKAAAAVDAFSMNLGQIALLPANYNPSPVEISNLKVDKELNEFTNDIRISWDYTWTNEFDHFDIYMKTTDGTSTLVGQTRDLGFYIPEFDRNGEDANLTLEVVPVMKDGIEKAPSTLTLDYPQPTVPDVTLSLGKSYLLVGDTTSITAIASGNPTAWNWTLPDGLELQEGSSLQDSTIHVKATKEGKMKVKVEVTNSVGTSTYEGEAIDVFGSTVELQDVENVVKLKKVVDYSASTNDTEVPDNIIDGVQKPYYSSEKWCSTKPNNWVIFDCLGDYRIYGFKIYDGNSGPESGVDQIDSYKIYLSKDGENWTEAVSQKDVQDQSVKSCYIAPVSARYIKFVPHVNGTLRVWEFEAYGLDENRMLVDVASSMELEAEQTNNLVVKYNLNGGERSENFSCKVTVNGKVISVGDAEESQEDSTFTIPVTANKAIGTDTLKIRIENGEKYKEVSVPVIVNSNERPNILEGKKAILRLYSEDYGLNAAHVDKEISTLTDGNTEAQACTEDLVENPSTHKDDVWAIFTCDYPEGWDLSKVKIYLPDNNKGVNDNDEEGIVNKDVKIAVGNDSTRLTTVKTFENIGEVSQLEYVLPEHINCKYIAVICNLNAYQYASMAEVEAFEQYDELVPMVKNLSLKGWNEDVIVEATPSDEHITVALDDNGWALFKAGLSSWSDGIAGDDRIITSYQGEKFLLNDYASNNALFMKKEKDVEHEMTLDNPMNGEELHLVMTSINGTSSVKVKVNYEDGTSDESEISIEDWYDGWGTSGPFKNFGRIMTSDNNWLYDKDEAESGNNIKIYIRNVPTDKTKRVKSFTLTNLDDTHYPVLLAANMKTDKAILTKVDVVKSVTDRKVVGIYNLNGVKLQKLESGINIIKYSDGTTKKVIVR